MGLIHEKKDRESRASVPFTYYKCMYSTLMIVLCIGMYMKSTLIDFKPSNPNILENVL
jgi:hypothetical protein